MNGIQYILPSLILNKTTCEYIIDYQKKHHKNLEETFTLCVKLHVCYRCGKEKRIKEFKKSKNILTREHSIYCIECADAIHRLFLCKERLRIYKIKNNIVNLADSYIAATMKIPLNELRQYPELIEAKRLQMQINRILKNY